MHKVKFYFNLNPPLKKKIMADPSKPDGSTNKIYTFLKNIPINLDKSVLPISVTYTWFFNIFIICNDRSGFNLKC